jgi:hypothetical protein
MVSDKINITANAAVTLSSSSAETQELVKSLISRLANGDGDGEPKADRSGHFVSRVGNARVVWKREAGEVVVISVYIP